MTMDFVARMSRGRAWPDNLDQSFDPGGCVILNVEDQAAKVTVPRLKAAQADLEMINIVTRKVTIDQDGHDVRRPIDVRCDIDRIAGVIEKTPNCIAIVIDPITALIGDTESNSVTEVRNAMLALSDLAEAKHIAVIVVSHLSKGVGSSPAMRTLGSVGFTAAARSVWFVVENPEDKKTRRLFLPAKANYCAVRDGLGFSVATTDDGVPYLLWDAEPARISLDEAMTSKNTPKLDDAKAWLADFLADGTPKASTSVREASKDCGLTWGTVERAQKSLGVIKRKLSVTGGWSWELPRRTPLSDIYSSSDKDSVLGDSESQLRRTLSKPEERSLTDTTPLRFEANQPDSAERAAIQAVEAEEEARDRNGAA